MGCFVSLFEAKRTLRNQITDTITKLDSVFAEVDKLVYENAENLSGPYFVSRRGFLSSQRRFLANQAVYLISQAPALVADFEYARVGDAFSSIGDYDLANEYYLKAIEVSQNDYYKSMSIRAYARCLFEQGRIDEGRQKFKEAIAIIELNSDVNRWHVADTYQRWARIEADFQSRDKSQALLEKAKEAFLLISNRKRQEQGIANLMQIEGMISSMSHNK